MYLPNPLRIASRSQEMNAKKQSLVLGAGAVSAVAASLCCIGPLVALALGLGGFAGAAFFAKWRPLLLGLTLLVLGLAWYLACRKPKITLCSEPDRCAAKPVSQWHRLVLCGMTALVLGVTGFPALFAKMIGHLPCGMAPSGRLVAQKASLPLAIPSM